MKRLIAILLAAAASPALAQVDPHAGHEMSTMDQPAAEQRQDQHAGHAMPEQPVQAATQSEPTGTDQLPGSAEPPPVVHDRPADRHWDPQAMAAAADAEMNPPRASYSKVTFDLAEYTISEGRDGYRLEAEAWFGDLDRLVIKGRAEGAFGGPAERVELHALYSKALDPWWNVQFGLRQDIYPKPARSWAALGIEGRAPYQFEVQAFAFVSDKGQLTGRLEAAYDQRITQRFIFQPRIEFDLSAQDMPEQEIGSGLASAELGLRLRYEIRREFAPYIGVNWSWMAGRTADYARAAGHDTSERSAVAGVRFWF